MNHAINSVDVFGVGPVDHGFPPGVRVRYLHKPSGTATDEGTVTADRNLTVAWHGARYGYPIATRDDNGVEHHSHPLELKIISNN